MSSSDEDLQLILSMPSKHRTTPGRMSNSTSDDSDIEKIFQMRSTQSQRHSENNSPTTKDEVQSSIMLPPSSPSSDSVDILEKILTMPSPEKKRYSRKVVKQAFKESNVWKHNKMRQKKSINASKSETKGTKAGNPKTSQVNENEQQGSTLGSSLSSPNNLETDSEYHEDVKNNDALPTVMQKSDEDFFMQSKLGDPVLWCPAYEHLGTAKHGYQLHPHVIDYYLLQEWYERVKGRHSELTPRKVHYLDAVTLMTLQKGKLCDPIQTVLNLPQDEPISKIPILFLHVGPGTSFHLVLLNYAKQEVFVFRQHSRSAGPSETNMYGSWDDWGGNDIWETVSNALGWKLDQAQPKIIEPNWSHSELDFGSWVATMSHHLFDQGWEWTKDINGHPIAPTMPCMHLTREKIFHMVLRGVFGSYKFWNQANARLKYSMPPPQNILDDMHAGPLGFQRFKNLALVLASVRTRCHVCRDDNDDGPHAPPQLLVNHSSESQASVECVSADSDSTSSSSWDNAPTRKPRFNQQHTLPSMEMEIPPIDSDNDTDTGSMTGQNGEPFDDYTSAWAASHSNDPDIIPNTWTFDTTGMLVLEKHWNLWRDRGYRLKASFFSMFSPNSSTDITHHLLPYMDCTQESPEISDSGPSQQEKSEVSTQVAQNAQNQHTPPCDPPSQVITMGAQDMLDEAGPSQHTLKSQNVFVLGKTGDKKFIDVDLEKDAIKVPKQDIRISMDIDSVIWVTPKFTILGPMTLHLLPMLGGKPPFSSNNHVYVQVLCPPTREDQEMRKISSQTETFSLSQIPHTHFGQIGHGPGQFNVYIMFPRMIHRTPGTKRMSTFIPKVVQDLWFSEVVIPAARKCLQGYTGLDEYLPHSTEELHLRSGNLGGSKLLPLSSPTLHPLQDAIHSLIKEQPDLLGRFGSFFFAVDSRGIKMLSKQHTTTLQLYEELCDQFPQLNWSTMMDRSCGELFLDLGISYHPPVQEEPLVGLWRLTPVMKSHQLMGMRKGTSFYSCTLAKYGGCQAEMKKGNLKKVPLCFRSTYNLCFQLVRNSGKTQYLCKEEDAIRVNNSFLTSCENWITLFQMAQTHSYGVREELRGSGKAVVELLPVAEQKAVDYLDSDPVLWIKAEVFFKFLHRRLVELQNVQITLAQLQPSNYGILSGIILHLMRYVMVTPRISHKFIHQALQQLQFRKISDDFGMFFLHNLKMKKGLLKDILSDDTREVRLAYAKALTKKKASAPAHPHKRDEANYKKAYPWGPSPSWTRIQDLLETDPDSFLRKWKPDLNWKEPTHQQCTDLFIQFTSDLWLSLAEGFASQATLPKPKTLVEAMQSWTVSKIIQALGEYQCRFIASAHGLTGKLPPNLQTHVSFVSRRTIFFPDITVSENFSDKSIWKPYTQNYGYISKYHHYIKEWSDEEVTQLNQDLDMIFSHLQCLPMSDSHIIWTSAQRKVVFATNSKYYKVESVGSGRQANDCNKRPKRPQASITQLRKRLHEEHGGGLVMTSQQPAKEIKKSRGKRKPPQNTGVTKKASISSRRNVMVPLAALQNLRSRRESSQEIEEMEADDEKDGSEDNNEFSGGENEWSSKVDKFGNMVESPEGSSSGW